MDALKMRSRLAVLATLAVFPTSAFAAAPDPAPAGLEARLQMLEAQVVALRAELEAAKAAQSGAGGNVRAVAARGDDAPSKAVVPSETKPAPAPEGFRDGTSTIRIGGFVKMTAASSRFSDGEVATNTLGRDFYLPQAIPVGGGNASRVQDFSAKQTRLWLNLSTPVAGHVLKGYIETDFQTSPGTQGSQRTTNGYNLALRRAYVQIDRVTIGQDWSTFQNPGALPQTTDFIGVTEGTAFVRQPLIRYSAPLGAGLMLHVSVENPEAGTAAPGSPSLTENGDDRIPDFAARLAYAGKGAELSLAGLARQISAESGAFKQSRSGWAISASGKVFLDKERGSDLRFMASYGSGAGRYLGMNLAPDAIVDASGGRLASVSELAGFAALHVGVTKQVHVNLMASYQGIDYPQGFAPGSFDAFNRRAYSAAGNVFYEPFAALEIGFEYRHGVRELVGGAVGTLDRMEFATKYGF
jgi:hypothetical protein